MRKLKLQVQLSVDGFMAGPNGEMDCLVFDWDDALKQYVTELTSTIDCIVLGRKLAEGFIPHWASIAANTNDPEQSAGKIFTDTPKVVFSKTLDQSKWENTTLAKGDLITEINNLKEQSGKDIIAYGGATFVSSLFREGLIDEFHLFINPAAIGKGLSFYSSLGQKQKLKLIHAKTFPCGIVVMHYEKR